MTKLSVRQTLLIAVSALAIMPGCALAQTAGAPASPDNAGETPDVVIVGTRGSLKNAERVKRDADVILDGVSADDISALPDASISDSLVRITGVSSNDNPRGPNAVSIRGLGPDLTLVTVNSRLLPTAGGGDRRVDLAQLPSEGIAGAYIIKTPTASMLEGGVAGILDLRTIAPLDAKRQGLTVVGRALFQDNSRAMSDARHYADVGARAEVSYVKKLTDTLGVSVTYSFLQQYTGFAGVQVDNWRLGTGPRADLNADGKADALPTNVGVTSNFNDDLRHSAIGQLQWEPNNAVKLTLDGLFIMDRLYTGPNRFFANNIYNGTGLGAATSATVDSSNSAQAFSGTVALYRMPLNDQRAVDRTFGGGFNAQIGDGSFKASADLSYYKAIRRTHSLQAVVENDGANANAQRLPFSYNIADPLNISMTFSPLIADDYALSTFDDDLVRTTDEIYAARTDFSYTPASSSFVRSINFGVRLDRRDHRSSDDDTAYSWATLPARPDLDSSYLQLPGNPYGSIASLYGGAGAVNFPYFDIFKLRPLTSAAGVVINTQFANDLAGTYRTREDTAAFYAQVNVKSGPFTGNAGLRYVVTTGTTSGSSGTTPANVTPQSFENTYRYLLPSANLKFDITQHLLARFAYSKTFSRQKFADLKVSSAVDLTTVPNGVLTITRGNPNLKPFTANSFDLSLEWYPDKATGISVAVYAKSITNFLISTTEVTSVTLTNGTTVPAQIITTVNDPKQRYLRGVELNIRRDLDFLPGPLRNLGVQFNMNYNGTNIQQTVASLVGTTAPSMPDQFSKFVLNGQIYYSTQKIDLRIAYRYFNPYIRAFFGSYQEQPKGQFDISGGYTIINGVRVIGSVTNLFGARMRRYLVDSRDAANTSLTQLSVYQGKVATVGLRLTF